MYNVKSFIRVSYIKDTILYLFNILRIHLWFLNYIRSYKYKNNKQTTKCITINIKRKLFS